MQIEIVLEKLYFSQSNQYEELFFFTAYAFNQDKKEFKIQGLSTPELNKVNDLKQVSFKFDINLTSN